MNGLGKHLEKNPIEKIENSKNQSEIAAREQETTSEKANFYSNTVSTLWKLRKTTHFFVPLPASA